MEHNSNPSPGVHHEPDWAALWRELADAFWRHIYDGDNSTNDRWASRARQFDASVKRRRDEYDPIRQFVLDKIAGPSTLLDIGAGTGGCVLPASGVVRRVTALEPSASMRAILQENLASEGITNTAVFGGRWEDTEFEHHDFVLCSHAMYTSPDLIAFVRKMERTARQSCFLLMRVPALDGVMAELSRALRGHPHDSPNFLVGYNALLSAGILPNVMIEPRLKAWHNHTMDEALERAKRHLRLADDAHDKMVQEALARRLVWRDDEYWWPDGMRSALMWWDVTSTE